MAKRGRKSIEQALGDPEVANKVFASRMQGLSWAQIARLHGIGRTTARRLYAKAATAAARQG